MEEKGRLYLLKFDHLSGEEVGYLVETLYERGAYDVQVVSSMTKKDRPSYLVLVDTSMLDENLLELTRKFGISGYHRIETVHLFNAVMHETRQFIFHYKGQTLKVDLRVKAIEDPSAPLSARFEYDELVDLCDRIRQAFGVEPGLPGLRRLIESCLVRGEPLEVNLDQER
jgi:uncharacterized protein (DUF111 family)